MDPRIGRRWNLDPVLHEWQSDYSVFANNPIVFADPSGLDCVCGGNGGGDSVNPECNGHDGDNDNSDREEHGNENDNNSNDFSFLETPTYFKQEEQSRPNTAINLEEKKLVEKAELASDMPVNSPVNKKIKNNKETKKTNNKSAIKACMPVALVCVALDGPAPFGDAIAGIVLAGAWYYDYTHSDDVVVPYVETQPEEQQKLYVTYTKFNYVTGETYVGRTSGYGTATQIVAIRDQFHHKNDEFGYMPAIVDKSSYNYASIRGREQQMIVAFGGAWSTVGRGNTKSGNAINGIWEFNPLKSFYLNSATFEFGIPPK